MTIILYDSFGNAQFTRGHGIQCIASTYQNMEMHRVTEILMEPVTRRFFIEWKGSTPINKEVLDRYGYLHTVHHHKSIWGYELCVPCVLVVIRDKDSLFLFDTYEDAITYEVSCLDELRRNGVIFQ